jgi:ABC-type Fe3+/spermidine/putrescine transport system ATPase subunit
LVSVSKDYPGTRPLDQVSMHIPAGPHTAILGPSGCGKSTFLRLLAGLEAPTAGSILLDGQTVSAAGQVLCPPHQRGVAMVFQDLALWPNLTVRGNVRLGLAGQRLHRDDSGRRLREALELCGIADLADRFPGQLSGGQQQRLALARAIAVQPRFLLLDEPFSGVDLATKSRLLAEIAALAARCHFQVILVSHDPWEALELCETAIILDQGVVQAAGGVRDLLAAGTWEPFASFRRLQQGIGLRGACDHEAAIRNQDEPEAR